MNTLPVDQFKHYARRHEMPTAARGHMPFAGHRTMAQVLAKSFECWGCMTQSLCPRRQECPWVRERPVA